MEPTAPPTRLGARPRKFGPCLQPGLTRLSCERNGRRRLRAIVAVEPDAIGRPSNGGDPLPSPVDKPDGPQKRHLDRKQCLDQPSERVPCDRPKQGVPVPLIHSAAGTRGHRGSVLQELNHFPPERTLLWQRHRRHLPVALLPPGLRKLLVLAKQALPFTAKRPHVIALAACRSRRSSPCPPTEHGLGATRSAARKSTAKGVTCFFPSGHGVVLMGWWLTCHGKFRTGRWSLEACGDTPVEWRSRSSDHRRYHCRRP